MSDARKAQEAELDAEIAYERDRPSRGLNTRTYWRDYIAKVGRARVVDKWTALDVANALREIHLNRWHGEPEVREALLDAREAATRLSAAISRSEKFR